MATTELTEHTRNGERRRRTAARLLIGSGVATGIAPLLPWVHYSGLVQTDAQPGGGAALIGLALGALLVLTGVRTVRSECSRGLAVAAGIASILAAAAGVVVAVGASADGGGFEQAEPGIGVYVLIAAGVAGMIGLVRSRRDAASRPSRHRAA
jgi:peptidoglycan/LPS O-acetylase OafA/YrhL